MDSPQAENPPRSPSAIFLELSLFSRYLEEAERIRTVESSQVPVISQPPAEPEKSPWRAKFQFLASCIGYSIGLGNVWRFPYLCYIHGGGSFLVCYFLMLALVGFPLFFLEACIGQFSGKTPVVLFQSLCPLFCGLGPAMLITNALVVVYYNVLIAWSLFYMFVSFTKHLPWETCDKSWASSECYTPAEAAFCDAKNLTYWNSSCHTNEYICDTLGFRIRDQMCLTAYNEIVDFNSLFERISAAEEYYKHYVLGISSGIDDIGGIRWQLALCLCIAWFFVFVCLIRGTYTSNKFVYLTAMFPFLILVVLLVRGVTLDGAKEGILFYVTPRLSDFQKPRIWGEAAVQVCFSLGPVFGGLITLSSYNKFSNNCLRDSILILICDVFISLSAGFITFCVVGYMATELKTSVEYVVQYGPSLAFVAYPEAVTTLTVSPLWSFLFFTVLLILGLSSQYAAVASIRSALEDVWPFLIKRRIQLLSVLCALFLLLGLPMTTNAGVYIFSLIDNYAINWNVLIIGALGCIVVTWIYGDFRKNVEEMLGFRISILWIICWRFVIPLLFAALLTSQWITRKPMEYGIYIYPMWAEIVSWVLSFLSVISVPIGAIYQIVKAGRKNLKLRSLLRPLDSWIPADGCPKDTRR